MLPVQQPADCPNPLCATPATLNLCSRFARGFGLQLGPGGPTGARWDDVHCLVCGHFSSPYAEARNSGRDLEDDTDWLTALDRALLVAKRGRLPRYLEGRQLGVADLLAMRQAVRELRRLRSMAKSGFPHVGLLRARSEDMVLPDIFGVAHGEAESEPFDRKVRVLGQLLGADAAEHAPRHCTASTPGPSWFFYDGACFIGLLCLEPNRAYRGTLTIDGCLDRLLHAG